MFTKTLSDGKGVRNRSRCKDFDAERGTARIALTGKTGITHCESLVESVAELRDMKEEY